MNTNDPTQMNKVLIIANAALVLCLVSFGVMIYHAKAERVVEAQSVQHLVNTSAFDNLSLQAKSAVVYDVNRGTVIFGKDENTPRPLASLTKVMTAVTALSILPKDSLITIKKEFLADEGDSGLYVDEKWTLKNLLNFSLLVSSNDGARSIASVVGATALGGTNYEMGRTDFIKRMNLTALSLGFSTLHFANETGLDESNADGGLGSALDVSKLMTYALKTYPDVIELTKDKSDVIYSLDKKHVAKNTDMAVDAIPNLLASKTGYTDRADGNLSIAFDAGIGRPIVITVLGSTYDGRFTDVTTLASSTLLYIKENNL